MYISNYIKNIIIQKYKFNPLQSCVVKPTKQLQNTNNDQIIESKIKECQRENGRCMEFTSKKLQIFYGYEKVSHILQRLSQRRECGNNYQDQFTQ